MARLSFEAFPRALDANGASASGAKLYVYAAGTTTPVTTYSDEAMTTAQAHPVVADSAGYFPQIYAPEGKYRIVVTNSADVTLDEADDVNQGGAGYATVAALKASGEGTRGTGSIWQAGGFRYEEVTTGEHLTTAGGAKLKVLPGPDGRYPVDAFNPKIAGVAGGNPAAIQLAVAAGPATLSKQDYEIEDPIYLDRADDLRGPIAEGIGRMGATIKKTTNNLGTGSNLMRGGAVTDGYGVDAILILRHNDESYNYGTTLEGFTLLGMGDNTTQYGIWAPRFSHNNWTDLYIFQCKTGVYTRDAWQNDFTRVVCDCATVSSGLAAVSGLTARGFASGTKGWHWDIDSSGGGTGTTCVWNACWARNAHQGWEIEGHVGGVMNGCSADACSEGAFFFTNSNIVFNGGTCEKILGLNSIVYVNASRVSFTGGFRPTNLYGNSGDAALRVDNGSRVTMIEAEWDDFVSVGGGLNLILQNGSHLTTIDSKLPANGGSFVSYSGGSTRTELTDGVLAFRDVAGSGRAAERTTAPGGQLFGINKSVLSAGSAILTVTASASGTFEHAGGKIKIFYSDQSFPNGAGYIEAAFAIHRQSSNYFQNVTAGLSSFAGNGFTTAPSFSISRSGNVWTITVTPAHGDMTAEMIDVDWHEAVSGNFTVALA